MYFKPKTAKGWNKFLLSNYGYGIWDFAYSLVEILKYRGYKYFYPPGTNFPPSLILDRKYWHESLLENAGKLENLKKHTIKVLSEYLIDCGMIDKKDSDETKEKFVTDLWDLRTFFRKLEKEAKFLKETNEHRPPWIGKGPPLKFINEVAYVWAGVMKDDKGRTQWRRLIELLGWFSIGLETSDYGRAYLSVDHLKHLKNLKGKKGENLCVRFSKIKKQKHYGYLEKERSYYFPIEKNRHHFQIEFTDRFINLDMLKDHRIIIFPNGERFEDESPEANHHPAPAMPKSKQKAIKIILTKEDKKRFQKYIRMRQEGGISLKGIPTIN